MSKKQYDYEQSGSNEEPHNFQDGLILKRQSHIDSILSGHTHLPAKYSFSQRHKNKNDLASSSKKRQVENGEMAQPYMQQIKFRMQKKPFVASNDTNEVISAERYTAPSLHNNRDTILEGADE